MNIKLSNNYVLVSESSQFILKQEMTPEDPSKDVYLIPVGYYSQLKEALKGYLKRAIRDSKAVTIEELLKDYKKLEKDIEEILSES